MKKTIDLPDPLSGKVKAIATTEGVSIKAIIAGAVEQRLNTGPRPLAELLDVLPVVSSRVLKNVRDRIVAGDVEDLVFQKGNSQCA